MMDGDLKEMGGTEGRREGRSSQYSNRDALKAEKRHSLMEGKE